MVDLERELLVHYAAHRGEATGGIPYSLLPRLVHEMFESAHPTAAPEPDDDAAEPVNDEVKE